MFQCECEADPLKEIKVVVVDEFTGLPLGTRIVPLQPNIKAKDICLAMARKMRLKHAEYFGLFVLLDGTGNFS